MSLSPEVAACPRCPIEAIEVRAYTIPTQSPESDGTLEWDSTTLVYVEVHAGGARGIGYTYADVATAKLIETILRECLLHEDAMKIGARWNDMARVTRNLGRGGITSMAISAVDVALWDLKGKIVEQPVFALLGAARDRVAVYGSGGFTAYSEAQLCAQLGGWVRDGIPRVKMKIGRDAKGDIERVAAARRTIGPETELFVDANGAYAVQEAISQAQRFAEQSVTWFEEPVFREDYAGTRVVRQHAPPGMEISDGEYGYGLYDFARMIDCGMLDVLQADATRCGGFSGLLAVDGLCQSTMTPLSTHCAPHLHLHAAMACKRLRHVEYFFDHSRIERMLFEGSTDPENGYLYPDPARPGIGLSLRRADAERYAV
ncbi:MAG TPA: enolase C-terminal domain-like protein [Candidatus Cybelea sp.]|jgi:L-alanine-DL-glutamate epimerase-like enolase superfamily enzyme|nr:enolase C-terminal domain-like protein [Candidatus Cybelea sp.]